MIGRDFYSIGSRRNILFRYGDTVGKPFAGILYIGTILNMVKDLSNYPLSIEVCWQF